jgi:pyruvate dehydrogenase E2 component (dihydrolipoamide acetyltransferase)
MAMRDEFGGDAMSTARRVTGWRKLAGGAWRGPDDPQFYGELDMDATTLLSYMDSLRVESGVRVTVTHLIGRAVAYALAEVPELNVRLARGRLHARDSIDVFFIVSAGDELTGVRVADADQKSSVQIAAELNQRVAEIDEGDDPGLGRGKALLARLPHRLVRPALRLAAWLTSDLNLDLSRFGLPRQAFGGAMITSVGMWGVTRAFSPLAGYYRVPVLVLVGAVQARPVAIDGEVVVRPMVTLTATFDHRYADASQAVRFADAVRRYCADPAALEPPTANQVGA